MKALTQEQMRRRWIAIGVVAVAYILSFFQRFAPAGIAPDLAAAFETSAASLGVLAATYFYVYHLYISAFQFNLMGYASALAWIFLIIVLALTVVQFTMQKRWVFYAGDDRSEGNTNG